MTHSKIRIDIQDGVLEVEGTEKFVLDVYKDYKEIFLNNITNKIKVGEPLKETVNNKTNIKEKGKTPQKPKKQKKPNIVNDLDLEGNENKPSLKTFVDETKSKTQYEKILLFVFYLKKFNKIENVNIDHIYTCFDWVGGKMPADIVNRVSETSAKNWTDSTNMKSIDTILIGEREIRDKMEKSPELTKYLPVR